MPSRQRQTAEPSAAYRPPPWQAWRDQVDLRLNRIEKWAIVGAVALFSPKIGGPNPADLVPAVIHLVSGG